MQLRYVFSELGQGLRRNLSMHLAVILTLFVSLTLVGLGVLFHLQAEKAADHWGSQLQIQVSLCTAEDNNPACVSEVTDAQRDAITAVIDENPEAAGWDLETKDEAFAKVKELYGADKFEGDNAVLTVDDMPQSLWVELQDPERFDGLVSAVGGLDGVSVVRDMRRYIEPIIGSINMLQWVSIATAAFLVLAALLLVANTIRLAAFARRKEIGIMRLVGASTLYIALPFLLEALVTALLGVLLATGALAAFMYFGIEQRGQDKLKFIPWIGMEQYGVAVVVVAVLGPLLTVLPTLVLTRKYLKV
ncbi:permease-like cell division protein FtsX [Nocardioides sp.]|uniref:permease-like cell division protein FtsX n=1 Tax=Nocardioides sp. TaxID=35761 RepID=UPI00286E83A8|nr:permease-like cell division protein FtsX [Nocardioides sp.]